MYKRIDSQFLEICKNILSENKTEEEWALIEADDYFNSEKYSGGFDATEMAFCFSYYDERNKEYFFQVTLDEIKRIVSGSLKEVNLIDA